MPMGRCTRNEFHFIRYHPGPRSPMTIDEIVQRFAAHFGLEIRPADKPAER